VGERVKRLLRRASGWPQRLDAASRPGPSVAIGLDDRGLVLFASRGEDRYRIVERLASDGHDATELFDRSAEPTLTLDEIRRLYGSDIPVLRLL
jgi:hypothetical protein